MKALVFAISLALSAPAAAQLAGHSKAEQAALARTNSKTWSKHGWKSLKWGMGPGDVKAAMKLADFSGEEGVYTATHPESIFGLSVSLTFMFDEQNRLELVTLAPIAVVPAYVETKFPELYKSDQCRKWFSEVLEALKTQYGQAECKGDIHRTCNFRQRDLGLYVSHYVHPVEACGPMSEVTYQELAPVEHEEAKARQKEINKL